MTRNIGRKALAQAAIAASNGVSMAAAAAKMANVAAHGVWANGVAAKWQ